MSSTSSIDQTTGSQIGSNTSSNSKSSSGIANESTFLTLLVEQLKNQDPMNPADSTQFVTQLAQFSSLEQLTNINTNVGHIEQVVAPAAATGSSSRDSSSSDSSSNSNIPSLLG